MIQIYFDLFVCFQREVERFMVDCMQCVGTPRDSAALLADNLTMADERGHFSHGLNRLAVYVKGGEYKYRSP